MFHQNLELCEGEETNKQWVRSGIQQTRFCQNPLKICIFSYCYLNILSLYNPTIFDWKCVKQTSEVKQSLMQMHNLHQGIVWLYASWHHLSERHEPCCWRWSRGFVEGKSERCFFCSLPYRTPWLILSESTSEFYCRERNRWATGV